MRSRAGAAVCVVSELMDVHTPLGRGIIALNVVGDCGRGRLVGLLESHSSADGRVSANDSNLW